MSDPAFISLPSATIGSAPARLRFIRGPDRRDALPLLAARAIYGDNSSPTSA